MTNNALAPPAQLYFFFFNFFFFAFFNLFFCQLERAPIKGDLPLSWKMWKSGTRKFGSCLNSSGKMLSKIDYWRKFRFLMKISIFDQNFDFWPKFRCLTKISIFDQNFDFWRKFRCLIKISIFDQHFMSFKIFHENTDIYQKFWFWPKIWKEGPTAAGYRKT